MAVHMKTCLISIFQEKINEILKRPEDFLTPRKKLAEDLKVLTKRLYDEVKDIETKREKCGWISRTNSDALPELIIDGFDDEQIWQELELQNNTFHCQALRDVSRLLAVKDCSRLALLPESIPADASDACGDEDEDEEAEEQADDDVGSMNSDGIETGNVDDDALSETSIELEKALDKKIAYDQEYGAQSESDGTDDEEQPDEEDEGEEDVEEEGEDVEEEGEEDVEEDGEEDDKVEAEKGSNKDNDIDEDMGLHSEDDDMNLLDLAEHTKGSKRISQDATLKRDSLYTEVDDLFFRMAELDEFLKGEDNKEMRKIDGKGGDSDEDEADFELFHDFKDEYGAGNSDDENASSSKKGARFLRYKDFFDPPKRQLQERHVEDNHEVSLDEQWINRHNRDVGKSSHKRKRQILEDDEGSKKDINEEYNFSESCKHGKDKSTFEKRQEKIQQRILQLEASNLSTKPWQMLGEASSAIRPENSLLQEHLHFDHMTKQAPVITEETTIRLEDVIKQRIKDQVWDDVERKIKPAEEPFEYKKKIVMDQEKSKMSLAQVYEQEYVKQQQTETVKEVEEPKDHKEIKKNMSMLFAKLDALSNFHFVPKPVRPELKIVNNLPAIMVEEVAPVSVSDATLLAPEEIKERPKGVELGKSERTVTDMKRERREKKVKQRARQKHRESKERLVAKLNPGLGNKYSKMAAMKKLADEDNVTLIGKSDKGGYHSLASSKNFFSQLQEELKPSVNAIMGVKVTNKKTKISVSKFKL